MLINSQSQMPWSAWHNQFHKSLKKNENLIPNQACLLLAVSGGQDSMAMLKLIVDLQRLHQWTIHVWHGDHGWHENSKKIAKELKDWCQKENLNFHCNCAIQSEAKTENSARIWRYKVLSETAEYITSLNPSSPCLHILTGHTNTDKTETFLLNIARGTDLAGLSSLRYSRKLTERINLIRPLLCFSRKDTEKICDEMNLPIWIDPSNEDLDLKRNKLRKKVIPILEELYKGSTNRIASLSERLANYHENQIALSKLAIESVLHSKGLSRNKLTDLPLLARATILKTWFNSLGLPEMSSSQLTEISFLLGKKSQSGSKDLSKGWKLMWTKNTLEVYQDVKD